VLARAAPVLAPALEVGGRSIRPLAKSEVMTDEWASLPGAELLALQSGWLAPARSRLLRRAGIAHRSSVLDLGAGYGAACDDLRRRSRGRVVALDRTLGPLKTIAQPGVLRVAGDGRWLPFARGTLDLVFCQCTLMWVKPLRQALDEISRVLEPGGILLAMEPDYGAMVEYPPSLVSRDLWLAALERAGADPEVGRRLPALIRAAGFSVDVHLLERVDPPSIHRFDFLRGLPLTAEEQVQLAAVEEQSRSLPADRQLIHLPFFLITAQVGPS
jgi:SAM-dependent methyltransferase